MESQESASAHEILDDAIACSDTGSEIADYLRKEAEDAVEETLTQTLYATATDIKSVIGGTKTDQLDNGIAGQAYQGAAGSSVIDVSSGVKHGDLGTSMVDTTMLDDVKKHEFEHEKQSAAWNAESVIVSPGIELTRYDVSETGAMSVQDNIEFVSADYKSLFAKVVSLVTAEEARDAARTGDLVGLAEKARDRKGITEQEYSMAG